MFTTVKLPARVGQMSLIGVGKQRPVGWGNYFWLNGETRSSSPRVVNMWAENMEHLVDTGVLDDQMIEGRLYEYNQHRWFLVVDSRVPTEYLYNKMCWTGGYVPPLEIAQSMFEVYGDPTNELQEWTDPVGYWAARGSTYYPDRGIVVTQIRAINTIQGTKNEDRS